MGEKRPKLTTRTESLEATLCAGPFPVLKICFLGFERPGVVPTHGRLEGLVRRSLGGGSRGFKLCMTTQRMSNFD